jgi:hypothetical protein
MAVEWKTEAGNLMVYTVSGQLGIGELEQAQQETDSLLMGGTGWRILVLLENFEGWSKEKGWEKTGLIDETDQNVDRMAFVGPMAWRDQVEMFTLKGLRPLEIEYFDEEAAARAWLGV